MSRTTQPQRRVTGRQQTGALSAAMEGKPAAMANPMDAQRALVSMPQGDRGPPISQVLLEIEDKARRGEIKPF